MFFLVFWTKHFVKCVLYKIDYICFLFLKADIQAFFAFKIEHIWMVNKCTRNSSLRMHSKGHAASNGQLSLLLFLQQFWIQDSPKIVKILPDQNSILFVSIVAQWSRFYRIWIRSFCQKSAKIVQIRPDKSPQTFWFLARDSDKIK